MKNEQRSVFVPTTYIWDVAQLQQTEVTSPEFKELLVRLYQNLNLMAIAVNLKETGYYDNSQEIVDGNLWFPNPALNSKSPTTPAFRQERRTVINFGALPNTGTKSVAHGITCTIATSFTRIYATATKPTTAFSYLPIPYASVTDVAHNIEINVDATNVNITTGIDRTAYTICYVVLEYLQT